ncbi:MAG: hypothetical protein JWP87_1417 [Labilithrix sp.]|nr:hypothetical protein [Labilithrix sp.]
MKSIAHTSLSALVAFAAVACGAPQGPIDTGEP